MRIYFVQIIHTRKRRKTWRKGAHKQVCSGRWCVPARVGQLWNQFSEGTLPEIHTLAGISSEGYSGASLAPENSLGNFRERNSGRLSTSAREGWLSHTNEDTLGYICHQRWLSGKFRQTYPGRVHWSTRDKMGENCKMHSSNHSGSTLLPEQSIGKFSE